MANAIVYGPRFSTFVRSVLLALEEKRVPYDVQEVDILKGEHQSAGYLARHPFGKVPAFSHDGFDLYETGAILQYVDGAFVDPRLQPGDVKARARMHQIIAVVGSYAYPAVITNIVIPRVVVPMLGGQTDEAAVAAALPEARKSMQALEQLIGSSSLCVGNELSLADIYLAPVYDYLQQMPEGEHVLVDAPALRRWWGVMKERPSVVATRPQLG